MDQVLISAIVFDIECLLGINIDAKSLSLIWIVITNKIDINNNCHDFISRVLAFLDMYRHCIISFIILISILGKRVGARAICLLGTAKYTVVNHWNICTGG